MAMRRSRLTIAPKLKASGVRRRQADAPALSVPMPVDAPAPSAAATKADRVVALLSRTEGATIAQMVELTGWKVRSMRGFLSGQLKAKRGLVVTSSKTDGVRTYRIAAEEA